MLGRKIDKNYLNILTSLPFKSPTNTDFCMGSGTQLIDDCRSCGPTGPRERIIEGVYEPLTIFLFSFPTILMSGRLFHAGSS